MTVLEGRHQGGASQGGNAVIQGSFSKQPICQLLTVSHEAGPPPEPPCLPLLVAAPVILLQTDSEFWGRGFCWFPGPELEFLTLAQSKPTQG